jgi:hypothetical protein
MPRTKVSRIVNTSRYLKVPVELLDGTTVYLLPRQELKDVVIMNLHKIKSQVQVEGEEITEVGVNLTEVNPPVSEGTKGGTVNLTEVKPPKYKRGTRNLNE